MPATRFAQVPNADRGSHKIHGSRLGNGGVVVSTQVRVGEEPHGLILWLQPGRYSLD